MPKIQLNKTIFVCFFVLIFVVVLVIYFLYFFKPLPYEKVVFSNTGCLKEQQKVMRILQEKFEDYDYLSTNDIPLKQQSSSKTYPSDVFICKIDLNNDKILDVVALISTSMFSGTLGSSTKIYLINKKGEWQNIISEATHGMIGIYKNKGYRDIGLVHICNTNNEKEGISIFRWDGKAYQYIGSKKLTIRDKEVFRND